MSRTNTRTSEDLDQMAREKYADLLIQSMMFDMDIDIETWSLVEKKEDTRQKWQKDWMSRRGQQDLDEYFDMDRDE